MTNENFRSGYARGWEQNRENWQEYVDSLEEKRNTQPSECRHCSTETTELTNYSRPYGAYVGPHWLCHFCDRTNSAAMQGAGSQPDRITQDVAAMLNHLVKLFQKVSEDPS